MERMIDRLRAIPEPQQERMAQFVLNELDEDDRWSASTAAHLDPLRRLADQILADDAAGRCEPLEPDQL